MPAKRKRTSTAAASPPPVDVPQPSSRDASGEDTEDPVLRELKHHARIPVPGPESWTLVGVADIHGQLEEGEIFACIDSPNDSRLIYLEGPCLISRSPTIHPGDIQMVHAIGRPPAGSALASESLRNTVVFSIQGMSRLMNNHVANSL